MTSTFVFEHRLHVAAPPAVAFMFFTPAGEEAWVPGWQPRYVDPADGRTRAGMVFSTGEGDETTHWLLADFDRNALRSRYLRCTPASRMSVVEIACAEAPGGSTVTVRYRITPLNAAGLDAVRAFEGDGFATMIAGWERTLAQQLPALAAQAIR